MSFVTFMRSTAGRVLRAGAGSLLVVIGLGVIGDGLGAALALVGLVMIAAGVFNACLAGPLFGCSIWGTPRSAGR
jgi:hypothetical protein